MAGNPGSCSDDDVAGKESFSKEEDDSALLLDMKKLSLGNESKKKFLLIFNLSSLLVHLVHKKEAYKIPKNRRPDAILSTKFVYRRPFCNEFLRFCLERFEVAIWSSAMVHNIDEVMEEIFGEYLCSKMLFVWNQDQCLNYGFKCEEKKPKPLFFKELNKVWESRHKQYKKGAFSATNTLLIDDSPYTSLLNPPNTAVHPYSYDPQDANDNALDPENGELGLYVKELAEADDAHSYVASRPFGQPPIKPGHPRWSFYSRLLSSINARKERMG